MELLRRAVSLTKLQGNKRMRSTIEEESFSFDHGNRKDEDGHEEEIFQIPIPCSFKLKSALQSSPLPSEEILDARSLKMKEVSFSDDMDIISYNRLTSRPRRWSAVPNVHEKIEKSPLTSSRRRSSTVPIVSNESEISPPASSRRQSSLSRISEDDSDSDSDSQSIRLEKFQTVLFNKFGAKLETAPGLIDAKSVSHVYKGTVLITDILDSKVSLYERSGKVQRTFMTKDVSEPWAATMTPDGHVAVTLRRQRCVALWSNDGQSMEVFGQGELQCPAGIAVDKTGRIFVADEQLNDVMVFNNSGGFLFKLSDFNESSSFTQPRYVCCSHSGRILVSDSGNHCVKIFDRNGQFLFKFGSFGKGNGQFKFPYGVCVDQHDNIVVADHHNDRVVMFSPDGEFIQNLVTCASGLRSPCGITIRCTHIRKLFITHGGLRSSEVVVYNLIPVDSELCINVKHFV